jgi:hypothetical protein
MPIDEDRNVVSGAAKERSPSMEKGANSGKHERNEFHSPRIASWTCRQPKSDERVLYRGVPQLSTSRKKTWAAALLALGH